MASERSAQRALDPSCRRGGALTSTSSRSSSTTMAHGDSTPARSLACNPRRRLQNVLSRQLHDLAPRGSRRLTVVMESRALIDGDGITGNTVSLTTESMVDSPLRNLPITQVMGVAHYLPRPALSEVFGRGRTGMARRARSRPASRAVFPRAVLAAQADRRHRLPEQGGDIRHPVQGRG
jgi:hypothetical protein